MEGNIFKSDLRADRTYYRLAGRTEAALITEPGVKPWMVKQIPLILLGGLPVMPMVSRRSRVQGDRCAASLRLALSAALRRDPEGQGNPALQT